MNAIGSIGRIRSPHPRATGRGFPFGRRAGRAATLPALAALMLLAGCSQSPLSARYQAERDAWSARRIERRMVLQGRIDRAVAERAIAAYQGILQKYPIAAARGDSAEARSLTRVRAGSMLKLARLYGQTDAPDKAVRLLWDGRREVGGDLESTLLVYGDLIQRLTAASSTDSLCDLYKEVMALPAATAAGAPVAPVLQAPLERAQALATSGRSAEASQALNEAVDFYDRVASEHRGSVAEVSALIQKASALARAGRMTEAETALRGARALPQAAPMEPSILFSLAMLHEQGLHDPSGAIAILRELIRLHPDDPTAAQAQLRVGIAFAGANQADSALSAFARTEQRYPRDEAVSSQARFMSGRVLLAQGKASEGLRSLRSVAADFPRTEVGLAAPLEVAAYYRKTGDKAAERATLSDAATEYERLARDLRGDGRQAQVVMAALDHLADARVAMEDWSKAVAALSTRADAFPADARSPLALVQAANILNAKLGDRKGAVEALEKLVDRYPHHTLARGVRDTIAKLKAGSGA